MISTTPGTTGAPLGALRRGWGRRAFRRWRSWRLPWIVAGIGWVVLAILAAAAVARLVAWDGNRVLAEINSTNGLFYIPAPVVLAAACIGRRPMLAGAALVLAAVGFAFSAPELLATRPLPRWAATAPSVRFLDANVGSDDGNDNMSGYAAQIRGYHPGLVTLEEITPWDFAQLERDGSLAGLRHRYEIHGTATWGFAIASKDVFHVDTVLWDDGNPFLVVLTVELPHGSVRLWVVHTDAPMISTALWSSDLERIAVRARMRGAGRLLVVGDFNASWGNKGFDAILGTGLSDSAAARGEPFDMTWSQGEPFPLIRIDHVLAGRGIAATRIVTAAGPGSDHREVRSTIAVEPR